MSNRKTYIYLIKYLKVNSTLKNFKKSYDYFQNLIYF